MKILLLTILFISSGILTGCGSNSKTHTENDGHSEHTTSGTINEIHTEDDGHSEHKKTGGSHEMKMIVDSEDGFLTDMIPHHQEAIDTAKVIITNTQNKQLKSLAQAIIDTQSKEVSMMKGLLDSKYSDSIKKANYMNMMNPNLATLSGKEQESSFLNGMISHHLAAVDMAKQLLEITQEEVLVNFANTIISTQTKEVKDMKHILEDMDRPAHEETGEH